MNQWGKTPCPPGIVLPWGSFGSLGNGFLLEPWRLGACRETGGLLCPGGSHICMFRIDPHLRSSWPMNILELPVGPALWKTHQFLSSLQGPLKWGSQSGEVNQLPPAGSVVAGTAERFETSFVWLSQTTLLFFQQHLATSNIAFYCFWWWWWCFVIVFVLNLQHGSRERGFLYALHFAESGEGDRDAAAARSSHLGSWALAGLSSHTGAPGVLSSA